MWFLKPLQCIQEIPTAMSKRTRLDSSNDDDLVIKKFKPEDTDESSDEIEAKSSDPDWDSLGLTLMPISDLDKHFCIPSTELNFDVFPEFDEERTKKTSSKKFYIL